MTLSFSAPTQGKGDGSATTAMPGTGTAPRFGVGTMIEYNGLRMNVQDVRERYFVKSVDGMSGAELRTTPDPLPDTDGEMPRQALYGGRTITLEMRIQAQTHEKLRDMEEAMATAFNDLSVERPLVFTSPNRQFYVNCKLAGAIARRDAQAGWEHFRDVQVTLRASNPCVLTVAESVASWVSDASSASERQVVAPVNAGNYRADPKIMLVGPMTNPVLRNGANGDVVSIVGTIPQGEDFVYDLSARPRRLVDSSGRRRFNMLGQGSDWMTLERAQEFPAGNGIFLTATGMSVGNSAVNVYWRDTWMP